MSPELIAIEKLAGPFYERWGVTGLLFAVLVIIIIYGYKFVGTLRKEYKDAQTEHSKRMREVQFEYAERMKELRDEYRQDRNEWITQCHEQTERMLTVITDITGAIKSLESTIKERK